MHILALRHAPIVVLHDHLFSPSHLSCFMFAWAPLYSLLKAAIADVSNIDVRDRALLYYRLLQHDVHEVSTCEYSISLSLDA
jgi:hypothetical protein